MVHRTMLRATMIGTLDICEPMKRSTGNHLLRESFTYYGPYSYGMLAIIGRAVACLAIHGEKKLNG